MIKPGKWFSGIVLVLLAGFAPAIFAAEVPMKPKPKAHASAKPVVWPVEDLKWVDTLGAPAGVKMAANPPGTFLSMLRNSGPCQKPDRSGLD